jgi:hypothetical protein
MDILNPHLLGADLALCGLSLLSGTLLRRISSGNLDKTTAGTAFVMLVICLFFWVSCLLLGRPKSVWLSTVSVGLGSVTMHLCATSTWRMV